MTKYQSLRGTHDILPDRSYIWQHIEQAIHDVFLSAGFLEIRTPIIEQVELFTRSIGGQTDIVSKEMYCFTDKGGRDIALRPEATASVVRAVVEHGLAPKDKVSKLYYAGPMFRYERPQAGRFRQFHQAGVEIFGSSSPCADVDAVLAGIALFDRLNIGSLQVEINTVGCPACRPLYEQKLRQYLADNEKHLCKDCKERMQKNVLRVLDCKDPACRSIADMAPSLSKMICKDCADHFEQFAASLADCKVQVSRNDKLVRGLDYYTKTTFEISSGDLGAQNALCGGGRYDNLVQDIGGVPTHAVGMAVGMERLISVMESRGVLPPKAKDTGVYFVSIKEAALKQSTKLAYDLRRAGVSAQADLSGKSIKSQFKTADIIGAKYVVIIGDEELQKGTVTVKEMKTAQQKEINANDLIEEIKKLC